MGNIRLYGSTSGYTELAPPAVAPDGVLSLPTGTGTLATQASVGLVKIVDQSFTAASTVSVNNCFSSAYENYRMMIILASTTTLNTFNIRLRLSGTDATGSDYAQQRLQADNTSLVGARLTGQTVARIGTLPDTGSMVANLDIFRPATATTTHAISSSVFFTGIPQYETWGITHNVATAYDGFSFILGAGTITGNLRIYGYQN